MKKAFAKATLGLTSTAFLATIGAQAVNADSYVVRTHVKCEYVGDCQ